MLDRWSNAVIIAGWTACTLVSLKLGTPVSATQIEARKGLIILEHGGHRKYRSKSNRRICQIANQGLGICAPSHHSFGPSTKPKRGLCGPTSKIQNPEFSAGNGQGETKIQDTDKRYTFQIVGL